MVLPFGIPLDVAAMIAFFAIVGLLLIWDRKNVNFHYGLVIRRWKQGGKIMDKWIFSNQSWLTTFGNIGVVIALIASIAGLVGILYFVSLNQQAAALILPTVGDFEYPTNAVVGVPFWFWIVSIFVVLTVHEPMHAIFARLARVPVRSWGIMTLLVIPIGAFVDPDMKKVQKLKFMQKMRIFAGGSFGNFITAGVVGLILLASGPFLIGQSTIPDTPAAAAGLEGEITAVNGVQIGSNFEGLTEVLLDIPVGTTIDIVTTEGIYAVTTSEAPNGGSYLGVGLGLKQSLMPWSEPISILMQLLRWLFIFNIGIGIFNTLPMKPFDGGHMFHAIFEKIFKKKQTADTAIIATSLLMFALVVYSIFGANLINAVIG